MNKIELTAVKEHLDIKKNTITYYTGITSGPGLIVLSDKSGEHGMIITNSIHDSGEVTVIMRPIGVPVKKYNVGEVIGTLVLFE